MHIGWGAVRAGAALALGVILATVVVVETIDAVVGIDGGSNWVFLFYLVVVGGLVAGGHLAARRRADAPVMHGVAAALTAYAVIAVLATLIRLFMDKASDPVALLFNALMASSAGILGGLLAGRGSAGVDRMDR